MIIEAQAPTRIDLAGGTVDIWPLYLFHENAQTINFAIDQYARCRVETRDDGKFVFESKDLNRKVEIAAHAALKEDTTLPLISKLVYFFKPETGLTITTDCMAPGGAGLAGSSTLNIALCGALNRLTGERFELKTTAVHRRQCRIASARRTRRVSGLFPGDIWRSLARQAIGRRRNPRRDRHRH